MRASSCRTRSSDRLEQLLAGLAEGEASDPLELPQDLVVPGLELLLELLRVRLAVGDTLLAPVELAPLCVELRLALVDALLDLRHLHAAVLNLALDLGAQEHGLLAGFDLRLAAGGLGLALGVGEQRSSRLLGETQPRRAHGPQPRPVPTAPAAIPIKHRNDREHGRSLREAFVPRRWPRLLTSGHRLHGGLPVNRSLLLSISVGVPSGALRSCRRSAGSRG